MAHLTCGIDVDGNAILIVVCFFGAAAFFGALELLRFMLEPRHLPSLRPPLALGELFIQTGHARYSVVHIERALFLFFMWTLLAMIFLLPAQIAMLVSIWWAWRRGVLR